MFSSTQSFKWSQHALELIHCHTVCGILQTRILERVAISFSRVSSWSRDWTCVSYISCIGRWILYHQHHLGSPDEEEETFYFLYFFFKWFTLHQRDDYSNQNNFGASSAVRTHSCFLAWQKGALDLLKPQTCHVLGTDHCNEHFPGSKAAKN